MGRQYKGLDHKKVTVKLDKNLTDIVGFYQQRSGGINESDAIRDMIAAVGGMFGLEDSTIEVIKNLYHIADLFDDLKGPTAPTYANALRTAGNLLALYCPATVVVLDDDRCINVFNIKDRLAKLSTK